MVDVADSFYTGEKDAEDIYKTFNRNIMGRKGRDGHLQPIKSGMFFCYNFAGHKNGQRVVVDRPGLCPKCGQELEPGNGTISL